MDSKFDCGKLSKLSLFFLEKATIEFKPALSIFCISSVSSACYLSDFGFHGVLYVSDKHAPVAICPICDRENTGTLI